MHRAILLFGYPGSGKGTQGKILAGLPGFRHIAMGDILRALTTDNPLFAEVQGVLGNGNLVPDQLVMKLFSQHLAGLPLGPDDFIIVDGLPRNRPQAELLKGVVDVIKVFKLSVYDESIVIDRIRRRALAGNRADDASDAVIQNRLVVYRRETESSITAYPGTILTRIQANQPIFDVHLDIMNALAKMRQIQFP